MGVGPAKLLKTAFEDWGRQGNSEPMNFTCVKVQDQDKLRPLRVGMILAVDFTPEGCNDDECMGGRSQNRTRRCAAICRGFDEQTGEWEFEHLRLPPLRWHAQSTDPRVERTVDGHIYLNNMTNPTCQLEGCVTQDGGRRCLVTAAVGDYDPDQCQPCMDDDMVFEHANLTNLRKKVLATDRSLYRKEVWCKHGQMCNYSLDGRACPQDHRRDPLQPEAFTHICHDPQCLEYFQADVAFRGFRQRNRALQELHAAEPPSRRPLPNVIHGIDHTIMLPGGPVSLEEQAARRRQRIGAEAAVENPAAKADRLAQEALDRLGPMTLPKGRNDGGDRVDADSSTTASTPTLADDQEDPSLPWAIAFPMEHIPLDEASESSAIVAQTAAKN